MSRSFQLRSTAALVAFLGLSACGSAPMHHQAAPADMGSREESFQVATLQDGELSSMRGGFVGIGGFNINFGVSIDTAINGNIVSSLNFSSDKLNGSLPKNIQQLLVQNGFAANQGNGSAPGNGASNTQITQNGNTGNPANTPPVTPPVGDVPSAAQTAQNATTGTQTGDSITAPNTPLINVPSAVQITQNAATGNQGGSTIITIPTVPANNPANNNVITVSQIIQNGPNNVFSPSINPATLGNSFLTVIQNNQDGAVISNLTTLNLTVHGLASLNNSAAAANSRFLSRVFR